MALAKLPYFDLCFCDGIPVFRHIWFFQNKPGLKQRRIPFISQNFRCSSFPFFRIIRTFFAKLEKSSWAYSKVYSIARRFTVERGQWVSVIIIYFRVSKSGQNFKLINFEFFKATFKIRFFIYINWNSWNLNCLIGN